MLRTKLLVLVFFTLSAVFFAGCKSNKHADQSTASTSDTLPSLDDGYGDLATVVEKNESVTPENIQEQVLTEDKSGNLVPETTETHNDVDKFYIVAGSFTLYNNAQKQNQKLKKMGYESKILEPYGQYHRVAVQEFATREAARAALPGLRNKIKDQTLWLLKR